MKVLLINSPIRLNAKPNCIPYGLATIGSVLRRSGIDVDIFDVNALRPTQEEILRECRNREWDLVGVSGLITTYKFQTWLIPKLKAMRPSAPIVSGGGLATSNGDTLLQRTALDIAVSGEGEQTMLALCSAMEEGQSIYNVPGIAFKKRGVVVRSAPRKVIASLDDISLPAWDLLPMDIYLKHAIWGGGANNSSDFNRSVAVKRSMNIISSRGCPYSCRYCYHLFGRSNYRFRSAEHVIHEIETLVDRYDVDFIGFVDDNMMASDGRLKRFCALMKERKIPVTWGCHGRVNSAMPRTLERMSEAGCVWIGYGIESGSQKILDAMNKKTTVSQAKDAILATRNAGIFANTTFIFGYPGETLETIQSTVQFKRDLDIECGSFFATPYPGTPLYAEIEHKIHDEESFILSLGDATTFSINLTDFSDEQLFRLKDAMDRNEDVM